MRLKSFAGVQEDPTSQLLLLQEDDLIAILMMD